MRAVWMIYDMIFLLAGCYGLSLCAKVNLSKDLRDIKVLMPRDVKPEDCLDAAGFLERIMPWMVLFGVTVVLNGAAGMLEDMNLGMPHGVKLGTLVICLATAATFFVMQRRAVDEFWEKGDEEE